MESKILSNWLKNPYQVDDQEKIILNDWITKYPFASLFHILRAKFQHIKNPNDATPFIEVAAVYSPSRKKLYQFIQSPEKTNLNPIQQSTTEPFNTEVLPATELILEEKEPPIFEKESLKNTSDKKLPSDFKIENDNLKNNSITESEPNPTSDLNYKSENILPDEFQSSKKRKEKKKKKKKKEKPSITPAEMYFTDWLHAVQKIKVPEKLKDETDPDFLLNKEDNKFLEQIIQSGFTNNYFEKKQNDKKEFTDKIPPEDFQISSLAKTSIIQNDDTVTETFAKILELQKNYSKAIQAYEKLSLKYPEKSTYFASRIEKIKKEI